MIRFISRHDKGESTTHKPLSIKRKYKLSVNDSNTYNLMYGRKAVEFFEIDQVCINSDLDFSTKLDIAMNILKPIK